MHHRSNEFVGLDVPRPPARLHPSSGGRHAAARVSSARRKRVIRREN